MALKFIFDIHVDTENKAIIVMLPLATLISPVSCFGETSEDFSET
jgi:hypothetical protein